MTFTCSVGTFSLPSAGGIDMTCSLYLKNGFQDWHNKV